MAVGRSMCSRSAPSAFEASDHERLNVEEFLPLVSPMDLDLRGFLNIAKKEGKT